MKNEVAVLQKFVVLLRDEQMNYIQTLKEVKEEVADLKKLQMEANRGNILMIIPDMAIPVQFCNIVTSVTGHGFRKQR